MGTGLLHSVVRLRRTKVGLPNEVLSMIVTSEQGYQNIALCEGLYDLFLEMTTPDSPFHQILLMVVFRRGKGSGVDNLGDNGSTKFLGYRKICNGLEG